MALRFNPEDIFHTTGGPPAGQTAADFAPGGYYNQQPLGSAMLPFNPNTQSPAVPVASPYIPANPNPNPFPPFFGGPWTGGPAPNIGQLDPALLAKVKAAFANMTSKPVTAPFQNPQNSFAGGGGGPFTRNLMSRAGYMGPSPFQAQPQQPAAAVDPRRIFQALAMNKAMGGFAGGSNMTPEQLMALRQQHQAQTPVGSARGGYQPTY